MTITLTKDGTPLTLPSDLLWSNEYEWQPVEQRGRYSVLGSLVLEAAARVAGRPITLEGGENYGWITRSTLTTLQTWVQLPSKTFTLNLLGVNHTVVFDHSAGALNALPVYQVSDPDPADFYIAVLRFLKV